MLNTNLPYNHSLKSRARSLRKAGNFSEVLFWQEIKKRQIYNLDFDRQKVIGNYIVDFYCASLGLVIEIDGISHDGKSEYDKLRKEYLKSLGLKIIVFQDIDVKRRLCDLIDDLKYFIRKNYSPSLAEWVDAKRTG